MTTERDTRTRVVLSWLREDAHEDAERVLLRALDEVDTTPQRRHLGAARRSLDMPAIRIALTAAAVLTVAFLGYRLVADPSGPGGPPSPTPSPTPSPGPSTQVHDGPGAIPAGRWAMDIGTVASGTVRVTFDIPNGWQENIVPNVIWTSGSEARFGFSFVDNLYADPCDASTEREPAVGPTVDDLATALASLPGIDASGPTDVALAGFEGKLVEFELAASETPCTEGGPFLWPIPSIGEAAPLETDARSRFWILDVDGARLVVHTTEQATISPTLRAQLEAVLGSLQIEP